MNRKKQVSDEEICPRCLGAGDLPGKRGNHASISEIRKCWNCCGTGRVKKPDSETHTANPYPISLYKGNIINVLYHISDMHGVWYDISIAHDNGEGHALHLIHADLGNWLNKVIDAKEHFTKEYYDMLLFNWDNIMKHINACIAWVQQNPAQPKYEKGEKVQITNHDSLEGERDVVKTYCIAPFLGYYYILEKLSLSKDSYIKFSEDNLISA
jgi:hypothetical protein